MVFSFQSLLSISNLALAFFASNGLAAQISSPLSSKINGPIKFTPIDFNALAPSQKFVISNPAILNNKIITVPLVETSLQSSEKFEDISAAALKYSLPTVLSQFKFPAGQIPDKVTKGIPLLNEAVLALLNGQSLDAVKTPRKLAARNILGDLFDWLGDVLSDGACGVFAAGALPGYLAAAAIFAAKNPGPGLSTTIDQDFFIFPLHGDIGHQGPVSIHYNAAFAPGFGGSAGVTMGKHIYTILDNNSKGTDPDFVRVTRLMLHELTHSKQYQAVSWNLAAFGTEYLFDFCKAGFSYEKDAMEVEAYTKQEYLNQLLTEPFGRRFFLIWRQKSLSSALGLPTQQKYTQISSTPLFAELFFQKGVMQIKDSCFRTFTNSEIQARTAASCTIKPLCKRDLSRRAPLPPRDSDGGSGGDFPECDSDIIKQQNQKCSAKKATWAALDARAFDCSAVLPPLPPPALPGCPPSCQIMTTIPSTAKPCLINDIPPPNCDGDFVKQHNAACKAQKARCGVV